MLCEHDDLRLHRRQSRQGFGEPHHPAPARKGKVQAPGVKFRAAQLDQYEECFSETPHLTRPITILS